jgi:hypothetical protein
MKEDTPPATVELHIEEMVLHGFATGDRHRIGDAVERELARLMASQGLPAIDTSVAIDRLDGGTFQASPTAPARQLGEQVADQVYRELAPALNGPRQTQAGRTDS